MKQQFAKIRIAGPRKSWKEWVGVRDWCPFRVGKCHWGHIKQHQSNSARHVATASSKLNFLAVWKVSCCMVGGKRRGRKEERTKGRRNKFKLVWPTQWKCFRKLTRLPNQRTMQLQERPLRARESPATQPAPCQNASCANGFANFGTPLLRITSNVTYGRYKPNAKGFKRWERGEISVQFRNFKKSFPTLELEIWLIAPDPYIQIYITHIWTKLRLRIFSNCSAVYKTCRSLRLDLSFHRGI